MKNVLNNQALEGLGHKVASVAQSGVNRSKQLAEIAKLRLDNLSEEDAIKKAYVEIGKLYYAEHGDAPEGAYVALCSRIAKAHDTIEANLAQISGLKQTAAVTEEDFADDLQQQEPVEAAPAAEEPVPDQEAAYEEEAPVAEVLTADEAAPAEEPIPDEE
ncbi:MAG: serine proteinase [Oscillospiraceae bacterium]|nr:serine proteinase [Oscillospiraceae bacterium]